MRLYEGERDGEEGRQLICLAWALAWEVAPPREYFHHRYLVKAGRRGTGEGFGTKQSRSRSPHNCPNLKA